MTLVLTRLELAMTSQDVYMKAYLLWIAAVTLKIFLESIGIPKYWVGRLFGLSPRNLHILRERARMTRKLWLKVMYRDKWRCQIRHTQTCMYKAQDVDHIIPLAKFGRTEESNLQAACHPCNMWKGTKIL